MPERFPHTLRNIVGEAEPYLNQVAIPIHHAPCFCEQGRAIEIIRNGECFLGQLSVFDAFQLICAQPSWWSTLTNGINRTANARWFQQVWGEKALKFLLAWGGVD